MSESRSRRWPFFFLLMIYWHGRSHCKSFSAIHYGCSSHIILCTDNVCFFMSTRVSMFIFIFIFHSPPSRPARHRCSAAVRRGDWCACVCISIYKYKYHACVGLCARNSRLLFTRKIKCTKYTCNKKINKTDRRIIIIFFCLFRASGVT